MFIVRDTLNGNNLVEDFYYDPTFWKTKKFKNSKITSYDVKRSFLKIYQIILHYDQTGDLELSLTI